MADKIRGITIDIGGDTSKLTSALKDVNSEISSTQKQLKDVEKLLKLDPTNTELLRQKQQLLSQAISQTKNKLDELKKLQAQMDANGIDKNSEQYMALQREIAATEQQLERLEKQSDASKTALEKLSNAAEKVANSADKIAEKTKSLSKAAAAVITAIGGLGLKAASSADDLNTLAKQTGFSTSALQKMQYAAQLIDVPIENITSSAARMTKQLASSEDKFTELGVSVRDSNGQFKSTEEIFSDTISALSEIENETERDAKAMEIFGKSANELAGVIDDGGAALRQYGDDAERLGLILSQDTLDSLNVLNDKVDTFKAETKMRLLEVGAVAADVFSPMLDNASESVEGVINALSKLSPRQLKSIVDVAAITALISPASKAIGVLSKSVSKLSEGIVAINAAPLVAAIGGIGTAATVAAAAAAGLIAIVEDFKTTSNAGFLGEGRTVEEYAQNVDDCRDSIEKLKEEYRQTAENGGDLTGIQHELDIATIALTHAEEELATATENAAAVTEEAAETSTELTEAEKQQQAEAEALKEKVDELAQAYVEAYDSALNSINGQLGLFGSFAAELSEDTDTAVEMLARWGEQTASLAAYTENLGKAARLGLNDGLVASLADGSAESAAYLQAIITEIENAENGMGTIGDSAEEAVEAFNEGFEKTTEARETLADTLAGMQTDLDAKLAEIISDIQGRAPDAEEAGTEVGAAIAAGAAEGIMAAAAGVAQEAVNMVTAAIAAAKAAAGSASGGAYRVGNLPGMANGGVISSGMALVGENGPELLTMLGSKAQITPLTAELSSNAINALRGSSGGGNTVVNVQFTGTLAALARVLQPEIAVVENSHGAKLIH